MKPDNAESAINELRKIKSSIKGDIWSAFIFSLGVNILMLTGPLFMLQIYDRVLASGSEQTLIAMFLLVSGMFFFMGSLDYIRGRILARSGARLQSLLDSRAFEISVRRAVSPKERSEPNVILRDVEGIQQFFSSSVPFSFFDAPWSPLYVLVVFMLHWLLGVFVLFALVMILILAAWNQLSTVTSERESRLHSSRAEGASEAFRQEAEVIQAMGMTKSVESVWKLSRIKALNSQIIFSDKAGGFQVVAKTFRLFLQSAILALGAWLAISQEISPGGMIAASILMGRALAPAEQAISNWKNVLRVRGNWQSINNYFISTPVIPERTSIPRPNGFLHVKGLCVAAPHASSPVLNGISFSLKPGEAAVVIGRSACGKSSLARAMTGVWLPSRGEVRLDNATLDQWSPESKGAVIGYLPQDVGLFTGTVAHNISRMLKPDQGVVEAAKAAGAHEMILQMEQGYDTEIGESGAQLSGGQRQRIGLARALYKNPALIVLDEPNAHLDDEGSRALVSAIIESKRRGSIVIVMAHRPTVLAACDYVLMLEKGSQLAFGPKDEVLRKVVKNNPNVADLGQRK